MVFVKSHIPSRKFNVFKILSNIQIIPFEINLRKKMVSCIKLQRSIPEKQIFYPICDNLLEFYRSSHPEVFLGKGVLKICSKLQHNTHTEVRNNFTEIALWHGCSPVNLLHILRTPFPKNASGRLLLNSTQLDMKILSFLVILT